jgi:hypothetical protein
MRAKKARQDLTLLDVLIDGFEKNEIFDGFHWRNLPMPDEPSAIAKFSSFVEEARCWKGAPVAEETDGGRRLARWADLELRQLGRALMVRVRAPWFTDWWNEEGTWTDDPMGPIYEWIAQGRAKR